MKTSKQWTDTQAYDYEKPVLAAALLAFVSLGLHFVITRVDIPGTVMSHVAGEAIAAVLAALVGATLLSISVTGGQRWLKILGAGLLVVAGLDLLHMASSSAQALEAFGTEGVLAGWTSLLSRFVLGLISIFAVLSLPGRQKGEFRPANLVTPATVATGLVLAAGLVAILGPAREPEFRPENALSLATGSLLMLAFVLTFSRASNLRLMFLSLSVFLFSGGIADAVFMTYSNGLYDSQFGMFHLFKLFSYGVLLVGILAESMRLYRFEADARVHLGDINDSLNDANLHLTTATNDLKALNQIGRIASESRYVADRFVEIASVLVSRVRSDRTLVATVDKENLECRIEAVDGVAIPGRGPGDSLPLTGTVLWDVVVNRVSLQFDKTDIGRHSTQDPRLSADLQAGFRSWISTPVISEDEVVGVLMVRSRDEGVYGEREVRFLEQVASQIAGPVRLMRPPEREIA